MTNRYRIMAAITVALAVILMVGGTIGTSAISRSYQSKVIDQEGNENMTIAEAVLRNIETTNRFAGYLLNRYFFSGSSAAPENTFLETGNPDSLNAYLTECAGCIAFLDAKMVGFAPDGSSIASDGVDDNLVSVVRSDRTDHGDLIRHYIETQDGGMYLSYCFESGNGFRYSYLMPVEQMLHSVTENIITESGSWIAITNKAGNFLFLICQENHCLMSRQIIPEKLPALDLSELDRLSDAINQSQIKQYDGHDYLLSCTGVNLTNDTLVISVAEDMDGIKYRLSDTTVKLTAFTIIALFGIVMLALWAVRLLSVEQKTRDELRDQKANTRIHVQFTQEQRLKEMGIMSAAIAHEVNNLMTPIMANSLMLLDSAPQDDTDNYNSLLEIYNASERAKELIGKISTISHRDDQAVLVPLRPDDVLQKAYKVLDIMSSKKIRVVLSTQCGDTLIKGSEMHLLQIILNLCTNSFHAMEENGGVLTITSRLSDDGKRAEIVVSDTGGGIPEKDFGSIFDAFYTTKPAGKGTGLGLAIVRQLVRELGGTIAVENKGGGAEFVVSLPVFEK